MSSDESGRHLFGTILQHAKSFVSRYVLSITAPKTIHFIPPGMLSAMVQNSVSGAEGSITRVPYRRPGGWGCCLDCTIEKERTRADESEIAVSLMRVIAGYCYRDLLDVYEVT